MSEYIAEYDPRHENFSHKIWLLKPIMMQNLLMEVKQYPCEDGYICAIEQLGMEFSLFDKPSLERFVDEAIEQDLQWLWYMKGQGFIDIISKRTAFGTFFASMNDPHYIYQLQLWPMDDCVTLTRMTNTVEDGTHYTASFTPDDDENGELLGLLPEDFNQLQEGFHKEFKEIDYKTAVREIFEYWETKYDCLPATKKKSANKKKR